MAWLLRLVFTACFWFDDDGVRSTPREEEENRENSAQMEIKHALGSENGSEQTQVEAALLFELRPHVESEVFVQTSAAFVGLVLF